MITCYRLVEILNCLLLYTVHGSSQGVGSQLFTTVRMYSRPVERFEPRIPISRRLSKFGKNARVRWKLEEAYYIEPEGLPEAREFFDTTFCCGVES